MRPHRVMHARPKLPPPSDKHHVHLPRWAALPIKSIVSALNWAGRNKKPIGITAFIVALAYAPATWHHVTTFKAEAICYDLVPHGRALGAWQCTEVSEFCTYREANASDLFKVTFTPVSSHCKPDRLKGPPTPHALAVWAYRSLNEQMPDPEFLEPQTQVAEAEA